MITEMRRRVHEGADVWLVDGAMPTLSLRFNATIARCGSPIQPRRTAQPPRAPA
jgi:hypothetical protein